MVDFIFCTKQKKKLCTESKVINNCRELGMSQTSLNVTFFALELFRI